MEIRKQCQSTTAFPDRENIQVRKGTVVGRFELMSYGVKKYLKPPRN